VLAVVRGELPPSFIVRVCFRKTPNLIESRLACVGSRASPYLASRFCYVIEWTPRGPQSTLRRRTLRRDGTDVQGSIHTKTQPPTLPLPSRGGTVRSGTDLAACTRLGRVQCTSYGLDEHVVSTGPDGCEVQDPPCLGRLVGAARGFGWTAESPRVLATAESDFDLFDCILHNRPTLLKRGNGRVKARIVTLVFAML
jgi:hypothetical protein